MITKGKAKSWPLTNRKAYITGYLYRTKFSSKFRENRNRWIYIVTTKPNTSICIYPYAKKSEKTKLAIAAGTI